ncbi:MAG: Spy/CpxP family protein refolding chaperone [Betaproteobacteria bacterium]|nr:Spy/CpxP family protein refolding chaperone [Betaproteobacteria bacterium]
MKTTRSFIFTGLLAASLTALAAPALAQGHCGMMWDRQGDPAAFQKKMAQRMESRMIRLHDALKLTPEQEPAWKTYTGKMQPPSAPPAFDREAWSKLTTPERMEKMQEFAAARQQRMSEHLAAVKEFYAVLTPEQKKSFDTHFFQPRDKKDGKRGPSGKGQRPGGMGSGMSGMR